jgi:pseudaminic acid synthase
VSKLIRIGKRRVGKGQPVYIIAELSANHNRDFRQAVRLVKEAKKAGADAVKVQTYTPDTITIRCNDPHFRIGKGTLWEGKTLYDLYGEAYMPWEWHEDLQEVATGLDLDFFSTPFDPSAVDFLEKMGVPAYKIASFELVDIPLIRYAARTGKPLILSTGMADLSEIEDAVGTVRAEGNHQIALLKCTSAYPAPADEMNLRMIPYLAEMFNLPVGLSDHTLGITVPVAATALGACIIEKHFTLSRSLPGPDSSFSLEPKEFRKMVQAIRQTDDALGSIGFSTTEHETATRIFRRSLFAVRDIPKGGTITTDNVRSIRPGYGLPPKFLTTVLGRTANKRIKRGTPLNWDLLE